MAHTLTTVDDSDDEIPMLFEDSHRHPITDDYDILQDLGVGKFSVVRMAQHKRTNQKFAIKQIDRKVCPAELLIKEVNIMKKLSGCPGVIHLFDLYEEPDKPRTHLVMELVTGGELFDYIVKSSSYSEKSASDYIRQLCQTVEYLHSKNIVHRDLKPENMLFEDPSAQVLKLCDFGLADTLKDEFDFLTLAVGTKSYMAPEVSSNMGYGKPVDMYSIGVILYILLCGYLPIDPENGIYVLEFPPSEWSGISFEVKLLIKKLLDDSPAARPTATQVLKHPWVRGTNTSTKPLVGTLRNLQSWNQVGGRAITKPRGQVMDLFANPPPASPAPTPAVPAAGASASSSSERKASPNKPKVTKTKKAALPKMIDGNMVHPTNGTADASSVSSPTPTKKKTAVAAAATSASPSANGTSNGDSPAKTKVRRKTDRTKPSKSTESSSATLSPVVATKESKDGKDKSTSSAESSSSLTTPTSPSREPRLRAQVSERTKKFLEQQDAREATRRAESAERKARRRSVGVNGTRSRDRREVGGEKVEKAEKVEKIEKPLKKEKKDKKDKKEDKTEKVEKIEKTDKPEKVEKDKVSRRKSQKIPASSPLDLDAMIAAALDDGSTPQASPEPTRSPKVKRIKDKTVATDDNEVSKEPKKPKTRERSATTQEGPSSPRKEVNGSPRKKSAGTPKPAKTAVTTTPLKKSPSTSELASSEKPSKTQVSAQSGDYYPHRSSAPKLSTTAASKKASRKSMGSPSTSPKRSRPLEGPTSPAASPRALPAPSRAGSKHSVTGSSNVVTPTTKTITVTAMKKASPIAVRDDSDSESYTTVSSSTPGDRPKILLDSSSDSSDEKVIVRKQKTARKIVESTSSSSSRDS